MEYSIRKCREDDLDKIVVLCQKHAEYEKAAYNPEEKKEKLSEALFSEPKRLNCLVAVVGGEVIGYAAYTLDFSNWDAQQFIYLDCLYLEDDYRSFGIGAVFMEKVKEKGQAAGCVNMQWQTPEFNVKAIKFYKRIGGIGKEKVRFEFDFDDFSIH